MAHRTTALLGRELVKRTVLVVEDHPDERAIAAAMLAFAGFTVLEAEDAFTAQRLLDTRRPDLVLLDLRMPVKTGLDWLRELEANGRLRFTSVLVCTGLYDVYGEELRGMRLAGVISKPISVTHFIDQVRQAIELSA